MNYYLKVGDAWYRRKTNAYGILTRKKGNKWYYSLRSPSVADEKMMMVGEYSVASKLLYTNIDMGEVEVYYGSIKNRRKR